MKLAVRPLRVPLRAAHVAAHGTVLERELLHVAITAADGLSGHGEAAPLASYDGVDVDAVRDGLADCAPVLADYPGHAPVADVLARCAEITVLAPVLSAIDLALWDLAGRRAGLPVWRLLGGVGSAPPVLGVSRALTATDRSGAALQAAEARDAGFRTLKLKVGLGDDAGRLAAVRAFAGPGLALRIDANGAWSPELAAAQLAALAPAGIELCEEPVHGVAAIRALAGASEVPLALDESLAEPDALRAPAAAALACLKVVRHGGISGTLAAAERARAAGYEIFLASSLDGPLGIAAALHLAAVLRPSRDCGLATLADFARGDPLPARAGAIGVPDEPGLGGAALRAWYGS